MLIYFSQTYKTKQALPLEFNELQMKTLLARQSE
jgi:hypothetical protein